MKKFHITDEDGNTTIVEEVEETKEKTTDEDTVSTLTAEEITALKALAAKSSDILAFIEKKDMSDECESDKTDDKQKDIEDEDEDEDLDVDINVDKEKVVDTDEDKETSMKDSVGRIDKRTVVIDDSINNAIDIDNAFRKYYGGKK